MESDAFECFILLTLESPLEYSDVINLMHKLYWVFNNNSNFFKHHLFILSNTSQCVYYKSSLNVFTKGIVHVSYV